MYYTYILRSIAREYTYVGLSDNPERRIAQHNKGYNRTTKPYAPFRTLCIETHSSREEARKREKYLKSGVGREFVKKTFD